MRVMASLGDFPECGKPRVGRKGVDCGYKHVLPYWVVVANAFSLSTQEAEIGGSLLVQGQPGLWTEF